MYEYASFCFEFSENCRVIPSKRYQHLAGKWQKCVLEMNCLKQFILEIAKKKLDEFPLKYCGLSVGKVCKSCRSRQELSNDPSFERVFTCKNRLRYSRERASQRFRGDSIHVFMRTWKVTRWRGPQATTSAAFVSARSSTRRGVGRLTSLMPWHGYFGPDFPRPSKSVDSFFFFVIPHPLSVNFTLSSYGVVT